MLVRNANGGEKYILVILSLLYVGESFFERSMA